MMKTTKILTARAGGQHYSFSKVTITYIAISGQANDVSLGIDRSSLRHCWQQYGADEVNRNAAIAGQRAHSTESARLRGIASHS